MKKLKSKVQLNNYGFSLLEVIASILILSIILLSIFSLLTQSAKTTKNSEDIIEATFIAQAEMEKVYSATKLSNYTEPSCKNTILEIDKDIVDEKYKYKEISGSGCSITFEKYDKETNAYITLKLGPKSLANMSSILIIVYDKKNGTPKAQMQNTLEWGG